MSRSFVRLQRTPDGDTIISLMESVGGGAVSQPPESTHGLPELRPTTVADLRSFGDALRKVLSTCPAVAMELDLRASRQGEKPLHLEVTGHEEVAWELLHDQDFLGLDPKQPLARVVASQRAAPTLPRAFELPLRLCVILATEGVSPKEELQRIGAALRSSGLEHQLLVLTADPTLLDLDPAWATVEGTGASAYDLVERIRSFRPHVLHISSHGSQQHGSYLEISTPLHLKGLGEPIRLDAEHLRDLEPLELPWLMVLNACHVGGAQYDGSSMATKLVELGVPAVVAMREPIPNAEAEAFTEAYLPKVLRTLKLAHQQARGQNIPLLWSKLLPRARRTLRDLHNPADTDPATLPKRLWSVPLLVLDAQPLLVRAARDDVDPAELRDIEEQLIAGYASMTQFGAPTDLYTLFQRIWR